MSPGGTTAPVCSCVTDLYPTSSQKPRGVREPPPGISGGGSVRVDHPFGGRTGVPGCQKTLTPYALSASVTGWKYVVPPEEQLPLPPEVRPIALEPE